MRYFFFPFLFAMLTQTCHAHGHEIYYSSATDNGAAVSDSVFTRWEAGTSITLEAAKAYGINRCFAAEAINERVFSRMKGKSYKEGCTVPLSNLRYIRVLHYTSGQDILLGELVCDKDIADDLIYIFRQLFEARYPIERMVLVDRYDADDIRSMSANNTSCFNYRAVAGSRSLSNHSKGRAIDINPLYNPCVKWRNGKQTVSPPSGKPYSARGGKQTAYRKIDHNDLCYRLFTSRGFRWGGNWRTLKDYQHFEK